MISAMAAFRTKRTRGNSLTMSASGGKTDFAFERGHFGF